MSEGKRHDSYEMARFTVKWVHDEVFRAAVGKKAKELLDFEPLWTMLSAHMLDGVLAVKTDEEAIELRRVMRAANILRGRLRMLAAPEPQERMN